MVDWADPASGSARVIEDHLTRGGLDDGLVYDAVSVRLIEIGEAVEAISPEVLREARVLEYTSRTQDLTQRRESSGVHATRPCCARGMSRAPPLVGAMRLPA